jgi:hypothetical protein
MLMLGLGFEPMFEKLTSVRQVFSMTIFAIATGPSCPYRTMLFSDKSSRSSGEFVTPTQTDTTPLKLGLYTVAFPTVW